jgi:aminopeptidase
MASNRRLSHAVLLDRHAMVAVHVGLRPTLGQKVLLSFDQEAYPLARLITKHLYLAGASVVTPIVADGEMALARYRHARSESFDAFPEWLYQGMEAAYASGAARMGISGDNPGLLAGQDPDRINRASVAASKGSKPAMEYVTSSKINWSISACATKPWAKQAFPELSERKALTKLWRAIFAASRSDTEDPLKSWAEHNANLNARKAILNARRFSALHFRGPGTDLVVGLADGHNWAGGETKGGNGVTFNANLPTEEVFTTPHCHRVNGYVSATRPLSLHGNIVDGIRVRFEQGRIVEATARTGEDTLKHLLATDAGACRLGEIALVPHSSPISKSGLLFFNTLFDENAACHMAVGTSYAKCIEGGTTMSKEDLRARGANDSNIHVDWMIGSGEVDIDGICQSGDVVPVMRGCEWV